MRLDQKHASNKDCARRFHPGTYFYLWKVSWVINLKMCEWVIAFFQNCYGDSWAHVGRTSGVRHIVNISSHVHHGGHQDSGQARWCVLSIGTQGRMRAGTGVFWMLQLQYSFYYSMLPSPSTLHLLAGLLGKNSQGSAVGYERASLVWMCWGGCEV